MVLVWVAFVTVVIVALLLLVLLLLLLLYPSFCTIRPSESLFVQQDRLPLRGRKRRNVAYAITGAGSGVGKGTTHGIFIFPEHQFVDVLNLYLY